jgi:hypothetical protein
MSTRFHDTCQPDSMIHVNQIPWYMSTRFHDTCQPDSMIHVNQVPWYMSFRFHDTCQSDSLIHVNQIPWYTSTRFHYMKINDQQLNEIFWPCFPFCYNFYLMRKFSQVWETCKLCKYFVYISYLPGKKECLQISFTSSIHHHSTWNIIYKFIRNERDI